MNAQHPAAARASVKGSQSPIDVGWKLGENLFDPNVGESLGSKVFFRLLELFLVYAAISKAWGWAAYLEQMQFVVLRLGIANYIDPSWMFGTWPGRMNAALISAMMLVGFFRLWRGAYLVAALALIWQFSARYCLGEIPHSTNLAGTTLLIMGVGFAAFADPAWRTRFIVGMTYFYAGVAYSLAAVSKLIGTGITWPHGRHMQLWIHEKSVDSFSKFGSYDLNWLQQLILEHQWVGTVVLSFGLLSEAAGFLMWWKKLRMPVIAAILGLHLGIHIVMGIFFHLNMIQLVLMGLPIATLYAKVQGHQVLRPLERFIERFP